MSDLFGAKKPAKGWPQIDTDAVNDCIALTASVALGEWRCGQADLPIRPEGICCLIEAELKAGAKSYNPSRNG